METGRPNVEQQEPKGITQKSVSLSNSRVHNSSVETLYRYPRGAGAVGRLLVRISSCILLFSNGVPFALTGNSFTDFGVSIVAGVGICLGTFTSVIGIVAASLTLWSFVTEHSSYLLVHLATLILNIAIAILGPGAFSIDALLFGRRRVIR